MMRNLLRKPIIVSCLALALCIHEARAGEDNAQQLYQQAEACYNSAQGSMKQLRLAAKLYQEAADAGHADAQYMMAHLYAQGEIVPCETKLARKYLILAARSSREAQVLYATLQLNGQWGIERDERQACERLRGAAEAGDADAQYLLGSCYETGRGVTKDLEQAIKLWERAGEQNHIEALNALIGAYRESSPTKALQASVKAAKLGSAEASYYLGMHYRYPEQFLESGRQVAFKQFEAASMKGHVGASYEYGQCYLRGYGTEIDREKGLSYMMDAAGNGNTQAQLISAMCWMIGLGCEADKEEARYWLSRRRESLKGATKK